MLPKMTPTGILFKSRISPSHVRLGSEFTREFPGDWVNLPVLFLKKQDYLGNNAIREIQGGCSLIFQNQPGAGRRLVNTAKVTTLFLPPVKMASHLQLGY